MSNVDCKDDGTIHLMQPTLINSILQDLGLDTPNAVSKDMPVAASKVLSCHLSSPSFDGHFNR